MEDVRKQEVLDTLHIQKGILFAESSFVYRGTYSGRDIISKNSRFELSYTDTRGYVPVEWWVMSLTQAENEKRIDGEGITTIKLASGNNISFKKVSKIAENEIFGSFLNQWPLTKILDIGGLPQKTSFSSELEIPPIPPHVHSGNIIDGKAVKPGKLEAYFFPPLDIPPYNKDLGKVISRLGLKKDISKEKFKIALNEFAKSDLMYTLLQEYEIKPYSGWTIPAGTIHAPGPWVTFEIQLPQDDFNLAGWRLGERCKDNSLFDNMALKGLKNEGDFIEQVVNWEISTDQEFEKHYHKDIKIIDSGIWGRRFRIFFDQFYGEGWEIEPQQKLNLKKDRPIAGIVWSGSGIINDNQISHQNNKEFFIVPNTEIELKNNSDKKLIIFTFEPIGEK